MRGKTSDCKSLRIQLHLCALASVRSGYQKGSRHLSNYGNAAISSMTKEISFTCNAILESRYLSTQKYQICPSHVRAGTSATDKTRRARKCKRSHLKVRCIGKKLKAPSTRQKPEGEPVSTAQTRSLLRSVLDRESELIWNLLHTLLKSFSETTPPALNF